MRRKTNNDKPTKGTDYKSLPYAQTDDLKSRIKRWCDDNRHAIASCNVERLKLNDRDFDNWCFLLQIASVLGVYETAKQACLIICGQDKQMSENERFLANVREVMTSTPKLSSTALHNALLANDEWGWGDYNGYHLPITKKQMMDKLNAFKIKQRTINDKNSRYNGYKIEHLTPIFERYLPPLAVDDDNPFLDDD